MQRTFQMTLVKEKCLYFHLQIQESKYDKVIGARGRGFGTYLRRVVTLSKTLYSPKVLVIPRKRWLRPDMTEQLLTGTLTQTNKYYPGKSLPNFTDFGSKMCMFCIMLCNNLVG